MRDLRELGVTSKGSRTKLPADELLISEFEKRYGLTLPDDFRLFLRSVPDGGSPLKKIFRMTGEVWGVNRFRGLVRSEADAGLLRAMETWTQVLGPKHVPFAGDGCGNEFVLDLNHAPAPVLIVVHEEGCRTVELSPPFGEFIDALEEVPIDER